MKLYSRSNIVQPASFFKFAFVGTLVGEGLIMLVFFVPIFLLTLAAPRSAENSSEAQMMDQMVWMFPILLPVIVLMHALMFGGIITLGLWLYSRFGKLEIADAP